jgi:hypothetical protein
LWLPASASSSERLQHRGVLFSLVSIASSIIVFVSVSGRVSGCRLALSERLLARTILILAKFVRAQTREH